MPDSRTQCRRHFNSAGVASWIARRFKKNNLRRQFGNPIKISAFHASFKHHSLHNIVISGFPPFTIYVVLQYTNKRTHTDRHRDAHDEDGLRRRVMRLRQTLCGHIFVIFNCPTPF